MDMDNKAVQQMGELFKSAKKIERFDLYDKVEIPTLPASKFNLFVQGEGNGIDVANGGTKTRFTTNLFGDANVPENEVVVLTRMFKTYDPYWSATATVGGGVFTQNNEFLLSNIQHFEGNDDGYAPFLTIYRGGNQEKFLDLPLHMVPSGPTFSNNAIATQDIRNVFTFSEKAPLVLFNRLRFQVTIELVGTAVALAAPLQLGIVFQGFRFRPVLPEGAGEGKLAELLSAFR